MDKRTAYRLVRQYNPRIKALRAWEYVGILADAGALDKAFLNILS